MELLSIFSVETTFFTIFNYPMSYIEFFGTLFNLACVWLVARKNILNWPIGIVGVVLFAVLFYQLNLYADLFEQGYYFITGFIGWYTWTKARKNKPGGDEIEVTTNTVRTNLYWIGAIAFCTLVGTLAMQRLHLWLPVQFPEPASLPLLDVGTTVMSFVAQFLMIKKRLESWVLWIIVDCIAIGLYWYKGVALVSILYAIFLVIATSGLVTWYKTYRKEA